MTAFTSKFIILVLFDLAIFHAAIESICIQKTCEYWLKFGWAIYFLFIWKRNHTENFESFDFCMIDWFTCNQHLSIQMNISILKINFSHSPHSRYIFTIVSYLIGVFIFATIVGQVGNVITNRNANRLEFERLLDGAKTYMRHHKVRKNNYFLWISI